MKVLRVFLAAVIAAVMVLSLFLLFTARDGAVQANSPVEEWEIPEEDWVARYDSRYGHDEPHAIAADDFGYIYVTGSASDELRYSDYATMKYDPDGSQLWVRTYGFDNDFGSDDHAFDLTVDSSRNVYVTGEMATIKYDTNGNELWVKPYHEGDRFNSVDLFHAITVDNSGNVYVAGSGLGSVGSDDDWVTVKYDTNGNELWAARYEGPIAWGYDDTIDLAVDGSGNVYVTGLSESNGGYWDYLTIKYGPNGNELWVRRYDASGNGYDQASAIVVDDSNNVYVTGRSAETNYDYATIKYDTAGNELWVRRYNGPAGNYPDEASAIALDRSGNVYVTGYSQGPIYYQDYATVKYDANGNELWVRRYDGTGNYVDLATAIAVDGSNNIYVTGSSGGLNHDYDYATVKYDANGNELWVGRYDGPAIAYNSDEPSAIVVDSFDNVYVTGTSYGDGTGEDYATVKYSMDRDGDGLANVWEIKGIDIYRDGIIDLDLPALGANWLRKDIFVEVDHMEFHEPDTNAINDVVNAFANAPVPNPSGPDGITLHVILDEEIPHQDNIWMWADFATIRDAKLGPFGFGTAAERLRPNWPEIREAKRQVFRYCLFIHNYDYTTSSGLSHFPGNGFVVSLGSFTEVGGHNVGNRSEQAGTFMHELGHTLGLDHGGGDDVHAKPNYLSVMSYSRQFSDYIPNRRLDYSRAWLPSLNETNLDENLGIQGPAGDRTVYGPLIWNATVSRWQGFSVPSQGPIDWNRDGKLTDIGVNISVNDFTADDFGDTALTTLEGYNDWANLLYDFRRTENFARGVPVNVADPGMTWEFVQQMRNTIIIEFYNIAVTSTVGGEVTTPGEGTFTYTGGTVVNLVATPDAGYRFDDWTGDAGTVANVKAATTIITINGDYAITANFEKPTCGFATVADLGALGLVSLGLLAVWTMRRRRGPDYG